MPCNSGLAPPRLQRRFCPCCGYSGRELQGDRGQRTFVCPSCDLDLYARPARSYAEMEGFVEPTRPVSFDRLSRLIAQRVDPKKARRRRLLRAAGLVSLTLALAGAMLVGLMVFITAPI